MISRCAGTNGAIYCLCFVVALLCDNYGMTNAKSESNTAGRLSSWSKSSQYVTSTLTRGVASLRQRKDVSRVRHDDRKVRGCARRATATRMDIRGFRLRPIMKQGTASSIPETWTHYSSVEEARAGAKLMYHDDRVLRVMVVTDSGGSFVEWIER
jgi:hypothetical protein